jgi:hypothetical protein
LKPRSSGAGALLLATLAFVATPCRADAPARALLLLPACPLEGVTEQELRAALALELQADGVTLAEPGGDLGRSDLLLEVESSCHPGAELRLRVLFRDRERQRTLSLAELPRGTRARLLALSLAELVDRLEPKATAPEASEAPSTGEPPPAAPPATSDAPSSSPSPAPPPEPEPSDETVADEAPLDSPPESLDLARPIAFGVAPELRWFTPKSALFGGRLTFDTTRITGGAGLLVGRSGSNVGDVDALLVHGFAGYRLFHEELGRGLSLGLGPRVGVGWIQVAGSSSDAEIETSSASAPYFDASVFGELRADVSPLLRFSLGAEAGVARGLVALADGDPVASYDGFFVGGFLGLWLSP